MQVGIAQDRVAQQGVDQDRAGDPCPREVRARLIRVAAAVDARQVRPRDVDAMQVEADDRLVRQVAAVEVGAGRERDVRTVAVGLGPRRAHRRRGDADP
jgi:hypothetical protein